MSDTKNIWTERLKLLKLKVYSIHLKYTHETFLISSEFFMLIVQCSYVFFFFQMNKWITSKVNYQ